MADRTDEPEGDGAGFAIALLIAQIVFSAICWPWAPFVLLTVGGLACTTYRARQVELPAIVAVSTMINAIVAGFVLYRHAGPSAGWLAVGVAGVILFHLLI